MNTLELLKPFNYLRRLLMKRINKNYTQEKISKRKGECKKCGECCRGCSYLDKNTKLCIVYNKRPFTCYKDFPLDNLDKKIWNVKNCGYNFEK